MAAKRITSAVLAALKKGDTVYDTLVPGFLAKRQSARIAYMVRRKGRGGIHRVIGHEPLIDLPTAREAARKILAQHTLTRNSEPGARHTLAAGWLLYKASLLAKGEKRSPKTVRTYQKAMDRLSVSFRKTTLRAMAEDPSLFAAEYDRIAKDHQSAADASGRAIRAIYNYVRKRHDRTLPEQPPTIDRDVTSKKARNTSVLREEYMRAWWQRVQKLPDFIRQQAHLFCLLSGMRPDALLAMKLEHQRRDDLRLWHIPKPKGGEESAFDLLLSTHMHAVLKRCLAYAGRRGRANGYVFPALRGRGPLRDLARDAREVTWAQPRALRRGYATLAEEAIGVPRDTIAQLLNQKSSSAPRVTSLYIRSNPAGERLRHHQQEISDRIIAAIGDPALAEEPQEADQETIAAWVADAQPLPR